MILLGLPWWLRVIRICLPMQETSLIPESGRSSGEGNGNPLQYSCLGNPMDRGAWGAIVHGITKESNATEKLKQNNNKKMFLPIIGLSLFKFVLIRQDETINMKWKLRQLSEWIWKQEEISASIIHLWFFVFFSFSKNTFYFLSSFKFIPHLL